MILLWLPVFLVANIIHIAWTDEVDFGEIPEGYGRCTVSGDPIITGLDGNHFQLPINVSIKATYFRFMFSKDFNATLVPFPCNFNLQVEAEKIPKLDAFSYKISSFRGSIGFSKFEIHKDKKVMIDGDDVTLPFSNKMVKAYIPVGEKFAFVEPVQFFDDKECPLKIFFDGEGNGGILLGKYQYEGAVEALCGNFNGNNFDDYAPLGPRVILTGTSVQEKFAKSWLLAFHS